MLSLRNAVAAEQHLWHTYLWSLRLDLSGTSERAVHLTHDCGWMCCSREIVCSVGGKNADVSRGVRFVKAVPYVRASERAAVAFAKVQSMRREWTHGLR